jgi:hypothetical protein
MSDNPCDPKTRQEKKNKRGSTKEKQVYNKKHIRIYEACVMKRLHSSGLHKDSNISVNNDYTYNKKQVSFL